MNVHKILSEFNQISKAVKTRSLQNDSAGEKNCTIDQKIIGTPPQLQKDKSEDQMYLRRDRPNLHVSQAQIVACWGGLGNNTTAGQQDKLIVILSLNS